MTREEIKEQYQIALAEEQGKQIQWYFKAGEEWRDCVGGVLYGTHKLRIKPEPTKRIPTIYEVKEWFMENRVFKNKDGLLARISTIDVDKAPIGIDVYCLAIEDFCEQYTHVDGTSLLIEEV